MRLNHRHWRVINLTATAFLVATPSLAQSYVEGQALAMPKATVAIAGYVQKEFKPSPFGLGAAFLVSDGWSEAYVGPTWQPLPYFAVMGGVGLETSAFGTFGRFALVPAFFTETLTVVAIIETNRYAFSGDATAFFYDLMVKQMLGKTVGVGFKSRWGLGTGPLAEVRLGKTPVALWAAWTPYRWETAELTPGNGIAGLRFDL